MPEDPEDFADKVNFHSKGWARAMGLNFVKATGDEVVVEWEVADQHRQPFGIVHGGVYCGVIESICSVGASLAALPRNQMVVGADNQTSFLKAVRSGKLRAVATPITRGRKSHLWEGNVYDETERLIATGRVRLLCLPRDEELAGQKVERAG